MKHSAASHTRAILPLIEQLLMALVFLLAAAVCVRAFVYANTLSAENTRRDRALLRAQTLAETMKHAAAQGEDPYAAAAAALNGTAEGAGVILSYDAAWAPTEDALRYRLGAAAVDSGVAGLATAEIWFRDETEDRELLRFRISWQEVTWDE